ncbi:hypothetical protein TELCIR_14293 [Teladorsagia circumcincta]|uniref:Uncharacterized protein n=1 Tax=Teladorsagia circumcincta TaxID=45464 RepID=A0A2G9U1E2_TELCI|nr:hypothetical protein TELCIR_14293 [Teladorsagia circumcincta]
MPRRESMSRHGSTTHYRRNHQINNVIAALKRKTDVTGYAANGSPLKFRGCFETDFVVSDSSGGLLPGRGTCYVTEDDCNVFGMPWIKQLPDLYKAVRKYQIHRTIVVDLVSSYRDAIVANLRTRFPSVFKPGLGRCTTTKATLMLRADAIPVFKKKRPVQYANIAALDKEIDHLLAEDVLSPVTYSRWAAPIVVVDGQLWRRQADQLRPCQCKTDTTTPTDPLDLPLLPLAAETPVVYHDGESTEDQSPSQCDDEPPSTTRQARKRRPPIRLQVNPKKKTYTSCVRLRGRC